MLNVRLILSTYNPDSRTSRFRHNYDRNLSNELPPILKQRIFKNWYSQMSIIILNS